MRKFYHQPAFIGCVSLSTGIDYIDVYMSCFYSSQGGCASLPSIALTHQALSAHRSHERGSVHVILMARSARVASVRVYFFCSRHTTWILSAAAR